MEGALVALLCRTSDRTSGGARGARALARELGERLGIEARIVGSPGEPRPAPWDADLRTSRGCLLEAGGQVEDALSRGAFPILTASDCSICMTTLPAVLRHRPDAHVLWLDAHGDFNTPDTTPSGFLGGMCLAAACGVWDADLGSAPAVDPARVVMCGVRDLDAGERALVDLRGLKVERPSALGDRLAGLPVYVHLDLDVLDPSVFPAQFPAEGGLSDAGLRRLLAEVADRAEPLGLEITAFEAPEDEVSAGGLAELVTSIVEPLIAPHAQE
ncbi:MAG TPA: arginase family protein [Solirubrobacteraceae bacterium]|nr:arginase family protein [Solirubrobacteraceae bacterium]